MILIQNEEEHCEHIIDTVRYFEYLCLDDAHFMHMLDVKGDPDWTYSALSNFAHLASSTRRAALLFYSLLLATMMREAKKGVTH